MRFEHDCKRCAPLGEYEEYDLYVCARDRLIDTIIARYGNDPSEYTSGLPFAIKFKEGQFQSSARCKALAQAMDLALSLGYVMSKISA